MVMKMTIKRLRELIREVLVKEEATVPGRWSGDGEPVDDEDLERLANDGEPSSTDEDL